MGNETDDTSSSERQDDREYEESLERMDRVLSYTMYEFLARMKKSDAEAEARFRKLHCSQEKLESQLEYLLKNVVSNETPVGRIFLGKWGLVLMFLLGTGFGSAFEPRGDFFNGPALGRIVADPVPTEPLGLFGPSPPPGFCACVDKAGKKEPVDCPTNTETCDEEGRSACEEKHVGFAC